MTQPVCLIIGAGAGIGGNVARRFAREGYHACLARRTDKAGLDKLVAEIEAEGGSASGFILNAVEEGSIEQLVTHVEANVGPIAVAVFNLGAQIGDRGLASTTLKQFEMGWRMATFGLFRLAQVLFPYLEQRGKGVLLVTSATAAVRGNAGQHSHAAAMGGRRMLCQSLNAQFAARGIHIAHIVIDGVVDAPDTLGRMLGPERFQTLREKKGMANDGLLVPAEVANTYFHIAHQHRSAWTFELDLRAHSDLPWWNHASNPDLKLERPMLKLHHAPNTRAGRIVWLLEELQLPYELNRMEFHPRALKSDEHRARHPLGRVPVLEDGEVMLYESGAIVEFIIARHSNGALKPAVDSPLFPRYLQWFHYCEGMVMPPINTVMVHTLLLPPERRNEEVLGQAKRLLTKTLEPVNEALAGRDYMLGDLSGVDFMLGHACYTARRLGCMPEDMDHLQAYVKRLEARPAFVKCINI